MIIIGYMMGTFLTSMDFNVPKVFAAAGLVNNSHPIRFEEVMVITFIITHLIKLYQ